MKFGPPPEIAGAPLAKHGPPTAATDYRLAVRAPFRTALATTALLAPGPLLLVLGVRLFFREGAAVAAFLFVLGLLALGFWISTLLPSGWRSRLRE